MRQKVAFITGVSGQTGSYMCDLLISKGYFVVGLKRRTSSINTKNIDHLYLNKNFLMKYYDSDDPLCLVRLLQEYHPDEIYNFAAQSHVQVSFELPEQTTNTISLSSIRLFEAVRHVSPKSKIYTASSSELFGNNPELYEKPFSEDMKFMPASPYACAKLFSHHLSRVYREGYGLFISSGILGNHESPRRSETFVTRKVTLAAANIYHGLDKELRLYNLDASRDWGYAKEYAEAAWLMLQQETPDDFVIATGETHTVRELVETAFKCLNLDPYDYLVIDKKYERPVEVPILRGDYSKAKRILGWEPKVKFKQLIEMMIEHDLKYVEKNKLVYKI